jgi:hypothetical protein
VAFAQLREAEAGLQPGLLDRPRAKIYARQTASL